MASQMKSAVYDTMAVTIKANDYDFKANGQNLKFKGFMTLYVEGTDEKQEQEEGMLPELNEKRRSKTTKIKSKTKLYRTTTKIHRSKPSKSIRRKRT